MGRTASQIVWLRHALQPYGRILDARRQKSESGGGSPCKLPPVPRPDPWSVVEWPRSVRVKERPMNAVAAPVETSEVAILGRVIATEGEPLSPEAARFILARNVRPRRPPADGGPCGAGPPRHLDRGGSRRDRQLRTGRARHLAPEVQGTPGPEGSGTGREARPLTHGSGVVGRRLEAGLGPREYCRMPQACDELLFQIDHIIARQHGGRRGPATWPSPAMLGSRRHRASIVTGS